MKTKISLEQPNNEAKLRAGVLKRGRQLLLQILIIAGLLFLSAGTFRWPGAWVYLAIYVISILINSAILLRVNPEVIVERAQVRKETKSWDRRVSGVALVLNLAMLITAGLDWRFGWSPAVPLELWLAGLALFILGSALASWAMITNTYFATTVSIQEDRGHKVVSNGPYHYVRHPAYGGWILSNLATPIVLGTLWAVIPAVLLIICFVVRTALEDKTLAAELDGYPAYQRQVRYRLLPGVW